MTALEGRHARYAGWICGLAIANGLEVLPVVDEAGYYTDRVEVKLLRPISDGNPRVTVTLVVPPPPDDWELGQ